MTPVIPIRSKELARRHHAAALFVAAMLGLTLALTVLALLAHGRLYKPMGPPSLPDYLRFTMLFLGLGAVVLRRNRFRAMRLKDIAGVRGMSGFFETLQNTTIELAALGGAVGLIGFINTILTGDGFEMLRASVIAFAVLLFSYPRRSSWQRAADAIAQTVPGIIPPAE